MYTENASLRIVSNDGTGARKLVDHGGAYLHSPVWSHDGTRIAYVRGRNDENGHWTSHIWTVNVDGSHNNQRTEGDQIDRWPSWSPDDSKIAFERQIGSGRDEHGHLLDSDRHIVVMTSFGNDPKALNEGGRWEQSPAWSPDGSQLAYQTDGFVVVADPDGSNERRVHAAVYFGGGLSWSPDGRRIAFTRGDGSQSSIVIADVEGLDEEVVFDEGLRTLAPRWSPDGQRIAFHTIDDEGKHRVHVVGASGEPAAPAADCRPRGLSGTTTGFPLPDWAPTKGTVRVAVLFMDFPDAQATHTAEDEAALGLPWAEEYLEAASYGQLDVQFVPHRQWLRAPQSHSDYLEESPGGGLRVTGDAIYAAAIELIDDEIDFSGFHSLAVVLPSSHFSGGTAGGAVEVDGVSLRRHINNNRPLAEPVEPTGWGFVAAHELVHNLGLLDLYPYDSAAHEQPGPPSGQEWIPVRFGLMELNAYFLADASLLLRRTTKTYPDGGWEWRQVERLLPIEMLAWSRWQLGWLPEHQIQCVTGGTATVALAPISSADGAVAMAAVPIDQHQIIVIESRRQLGYDRGREFTWQRGGTGRMQALIEEGALVYTVDSFIGSGELPIKIAGDSGNGQVDEFPVLTRGESVTLHGYTITVTAADGDTHTVSITRDD